jgi:hypothetical protein
MPRRVVWYTLTCVLEELSASVDVCVKRRETAGIHNVIVRKMRLSSHHLQNFKTYIGNEYAFWNPTDELHVSARLFLGGWGVVVTWFGS